jgi:membrane associated rhomboid family serine protease
MQIPENRPSPELSKLLAGSREEAMDWSLVLISQGIESSVDYSSDRQRWEVWIAAQDYEHAVASINLYRSENRGWPWQKRVLKSGLRFDWGSLVWLFLIILFYSLDQKSNLSSQGLLDTSAVSHGQWWRIFTALWLHADLAHLSSNAALGLVLTGLVMGRFGTGLGLLAICLAGAGGNVASWGFANAPHLSLGASGMVMGCIGLLAAHRPYPWRQSPLRSRNLITSLCGASMLFILLGLEPKSDTVAHFGGFVTGLLIGWLLCLAPSRWRKPWSDFFSGIAFMLLVLVPWLLALKRG